MLQILISNVKSAHDWLFVEIGSSGESRSASPPMRGKIVKHVSAEASAMRTAAIVALIQEAHNGMLLGFKVIGPASLRKMWRKAVSMTSRDC